MYPCLTATLESHGAACVTSVPRAQLQHAAADAGGLCEGAAGDAAAPAADAAERAACAGCDRLAPAPAGDPSPCPGCSSCLQQIMLLSILALTPLCQTQVAALPVFACLYVNRSLHAQHMPCHDKALPYLSLGGRAAQHVILNHLYCQRNARGISATVVGATHRYKSKYITTVLYKPQRRGRASPPLGGDSGRSTPPMSD